MNRFYLTNCTAFDPHSGQRFPNAVVYIEAGRIARIQHVTDPLVHSIPTIDCRHGFLMPAFHDAHTHLWMGGEFLDKLDAAKITDKTDLLKRICEHADKARSRSGPESRGGWVLGYGLHPLRLKGGLPTAAELREAAGNVRVYIETNDLHSVFVGPDLLAAAGISRQSSDPAGGMIDRDRAGDPNGLLRENACALVRPLKPAPQKTEIKAAILRAQDYAFSLGITAVDENIRLFLFDAYRELLAEEKLKLAIHGWLIEKNLGPAVFDYRPIDEPRFRVDTLKLFSDGALGSRSAAIDGEYLSGGSGTFVADLADLDAFMRRGAEAGWRLTVHAIGDRAVARMLDIYESMDRDGLPVRSRRHRIEHAQMLRNGDVERFAHLGILPSLQPVHCAADQDGFAERLCREDQLRSFIWKSFDRQGCCMPLGSDWPVESLDPRLTLFHGHTQQSFSGQHLLDPQEALSVDRLLRGLTVDAAEAAFWEERRGSLKPGMDADLVLLAQDPAQIDPAELPALPIMGTWCAGEQVFKRGDLTSK